MKSTKPVLFVGLAVGALFAVSANSDTVEIRSSGWCLSYDQTSIAISDNNGPWPYFLIPAHFPTVSVADDPDRTVVSVGYSKSSEISRKHREQGISAFKSGCSVLPTEFDLNILVDEKGTDCSVFEFENFYVPNDFSQDHSSTRISCSKRDQTKACGMDVILSNNWEASILLPKTQLVSWRAVAEQAELFFDENLEDCGR